MQTVSTDCIDSTCTCILIYCTSCVGNRTKNFGRKLTSAVFRTAELCLTSNTAHPCGVDVLKVHAYKLAFYSKNTLQVSGFFLTGFFAIDCEILCHPLFNAVENTRELESQTAFLMIALTKLLLD